ncbi:MAG: endoribonuclease YbeY [Bacteroidia bacterium]|nr:MAG: endoribonuclease YbeY [Bacteroidia bacterium]
MRSIGVSPVIRFFYHPDLRPWRIPGANQHKKWLSHCISALQRGQELSRIYYSFIPLPEMCHLHEKFLQDPSPTDIMTFEYPTGEGIRVEAEIFVAPEQVRLQAAELRLPFEEELRRVLVHGILHILGWRDHTPEEQAAMRKTEDFCLSLWPQTCVSHETPRHRL